MAKYKVPAKFVFSGYFEIEADNAADARECVERHCGLVIGGDIHTTLPEEDVDWSFPIHSDKYIGRVSKIKS